MKVFANVRGKIFESEVKSIRQSAGDCYVCKLPVYTSHGQLVKYFRETPTHKKCRKNI